MAANDNIAFTSEQLNAASGGSGDASINDIIHNLDLSNLNTNPATPEASIEPTVDDPVVDTQANTQINSVPFTSKQLNAASGGQADPNMNDIIHNLNSNNVNDTTAMNAASGGQADPNMNDVIQNLVTNNDPNTVANMNEVSSGQADPNMNDVIHNIKQSDDVETTSETTFQKTVDELKEIYKEDEGEESSNLADAYQATAEEIKGVDPTTSQKVTDANAEQLTQELIALGYDPIAAAYQVEMAKREGKTIDELFGEYVDNDSEGLIEEINNPASLVSVYSLGNYNLDLSGLSNFTSDQVEEIKGSIQALRTPLSEIKTAIDGISGEFESLNEDTRAKLSAMEGSGMDLQIIALKAHELWSGYIDSICNKLGIALGTIGAADDQQPTGDVDPLQTPEEDDGNKKKGKSSSGEGNGPSSTKGGDEGNKKKPGEGTKAVYTVLGTLTFTALVPLITEFGKPSTIQSKLAEAYDVVGIFSYEGNYYYKIYDKNLASYYFAPIDGSSNFKTEYKEVLKSDQTNMMLKTPEAGEDVLAKMSDPNEVYFVNGTAPGQGDLKEVTFANVVDQTDNKNYYIAINETTQVVGIEDFVKSAIETATKNSNASSGTVNVG